MIAVLKSHTHRHSAPLSDSLAASWRWWRVTAARCLTLRPTVRPVPEGPAPAAPASGAGTATLPPFPPPALAGILPAAGRLPLPLSDTVIDGFKVPPYAPEVTP